MLAHPAFLRTKDKPRNHRLVCVCVGGASKKLLSTDKGSPRDSLLRQTELEKEADGSSAGEFTLSLVLLSLKEY